MRLMGWEYLILRSIRRLGAGVLRACRGVARWCARLRQHQTLAREEQAQATVEAAALLPAFLTLLLLVLQPVCLLYTRAVMESAAAETARLMVTTEGDADERIEAFALRRLAAVPNVSLFHAGGPLSWDISCSAAGEESGEVSVSIVGFVRPLPVLGVFARGMGATNAQGDVELAVTARYSGRPDWLEGSYETWTSQWD